MEGVAFDALDEQAQKIAAHVREHGANTHIPVIHDTEDLIVAAYTEIYTSVFPDLAGAVHEAYAAKLVRQIADLLQHWLEAARLLIASRPVRRRVKQVTQTTIDAINRITLIGLEQGLNVDRIADLIDGTEYGRPVEDRFPLVDPYTGPPVHDTTVRQRAQRIARTETMSAANAGGRQGVLDTGLNLRHYWIDVKGDNRTRDSHNTGIHPELAQPRGMHEPYILHGPHGAVSLMFPSDPNAQGGERAVAEETILCRCVEGYEVV
jgi:hypothetical protein